MTRSLWVAMALALAAATVRAESAPTVVITAAGWTVVADTDKCTFSLAHEKLGPLLRDMRLELKGEHGLASLQRWTAQKSAEDQLSITTTEPQTAWLLQLQPNLVKISCTSYATILVGLAVVSGDRPAVRLLDPQGTPVSWVGTNEVQGGFGGSETRNASFLPRQNPETMIFALGGVTGTNLQSLFDRKTDTAICFSDQAKIRPGNQTPNLLELTIPVHGNSTVRLIPDYYTKTLRVPFYTPFDDSHFPQAPAVWGSWTSYYEAVTEHDIVRITDWISANLKPYGFDFVQLDDGYDRGKAGEHYWIEKWDPLKFPHGPEWLASYIRSKGLRAGLWLVPNAYAGAVTQHPDWYLRDKQGKFILDYRTASLDSTHPQVLDFLRKEFTTLREWGFDYYKFDGEHAIPRHVPAVDKDKLFDKSIDPLVAYRNRLKVIRKTIGPASFIESCPAGTPLNGIGYVDSFFNGHDVYNSWQGMHALFSSINANAFLNHIVAYVMPGEGIEVGPPLSVEEAKKMRPPVVVRTAATREEPMKGFGTTMAEARTLVTWLALTGVTYAVASVLPELPEERVRLLQKTLPTMPIMPVDLFSRGTDMQWDKFKKTTPDTYIHNYPEILDLKVNSVPGNYDVVGLTNWRSGTARRELLFADNLGLPAGESYVAFDFWNQRLLGVFKDRLEIEVEAHDTRVLLLHPRTDHPWLAGISRHITGSYSTLGLKWDSKQSTLLGTAQPVPGEDYTLWLYVPEEMNIARVSASARDQQEIPVQFDRRGISLKLSFVGRPAPVDWEVRFTTRNGG